MIPIMKPTLPTLDAIEPGLSDILASGSVTSGKYVDEFERRCADYLGAKWAVAVSSGTTSLTLPIACMGLTGEVIVPSFSWCASAHVLRWNGVDPVFVDIERDTFQIDVEKAEQLITERTSGIMAVNLAGSTCDIESVTDLAERYGLRLIFDNAHAIGTEWKGQGVGGFGDVSCYSLSATKNITTGEGGIITTNDEQLLEKLRLARNQGVIDGNAQFVGMNARMSEFHAVIGLAALDLSEGFIVRKQALVSRYMEGLAGLPGVATQRIPESVRSSYKDLMLIIDDELFGMNRDQLAGWLAARGIATKKYYYPAIHQQEAYREYFARYDETLPETNYIAARCLSVPLYPAMTTAQVDLVLDALHEAHNSNARG